MSARRDAGHAPAGWRWGVPAAVGIGAAVWLVGFPLLQVPLALALLATAALVAWRPVALYIWLPALLPVLDLAPWSGQRGLDEFDLVLACGVAVAWTVVPPRGSARLPPAGGTLLAFLLVLTSLAISTLHAVWPPAAVDPNAYSNPLSPYNAVRLAKAGIEALLLWWLARRLRASGADPTSAFGSGMIYGLAGTVAWVIVERLAFSGLLDFTNDYRVAGPFSAMGLGGAYVECFLVVASLFLVDRLLTPRSSIHLLAGLALLVGAIYALMVTYSRGGYLALGAGLLVLLVVRLAPARYRVHRAVTGLALAAFAAVVAYPVLAGSYAQSRFATVSTDLATREAHWASSLQSMDRDLATQSFGMGLGQYASAMVARGDHAAGGHQWIEDGVGKPALRLGVGEAFFVDQIVPVRPGTTYRLRYRVRPASAANAAYVALCQKWIIASFECAGGAPLASLGKDATDPSGWRVVTSDVVAPVAGPRMPARPVRLSISNRGRVPLAFDQVSLRGDDGLDLVDNGDFGAGLDHWTYTSDQHLAWHAKSLPLGVYFEQGLFGLVALALLCAAGAMNALDAARSDLPGGAVFLAALAAFMVVGVIDSLLDTPRFLLLWLLLCVLPATLVPGFRKERVGAPSGRAARRGNT